jgi:hypothetical protein
LETIMTFIHVESDGNTVTAHVPMGTRTYTNAQWRNVWPTLMEQVVSGHPFILPEPETVASDSGEGLYAAQSALRRVADALPYVWPKTTEPDQINLADLTGEEVGRLAEMAAHQMETDFLK